VTNENRDFGREKDDLLETVSDQILPEIIVNMQ
jgi:hypothetical protein